MVWNEVDFLTVVHFILYGMMKCGMFFPDEHGARYTNQVQWFIELNKLTLREPCPCSTIVWRYGMRKPGSKTGMSPVCENRPHTVYARVCRGMCKMIERSLLEILVKGGTVSLLCRSELATVGKWGVTSLLRQRRKLNGKGTMSRLRERRDVISLRYWGFL